MSVIEVFISVGWIFSYDFEVFFVLSMPNNFLLCFGHFEDYVLKLSVLFKCRGNDDVFVLARSLVEATNSNHLSVGCGFNLCSIFQTFAVNCV